VLFNVNYHTERHVKSLVSENKLLLRYRLEGKTIIRRKNCPLPAYSVLTSLHLHLKHLAQHQKGLLRMILDFRTKKYV